MPGRFATGAFRVLAHLVSLILLAAKAGAAADVDDFSWLRGANYVPSYARNDVQIWIDYDPAVIDRELGYAEKLKLNCVRVFLQVAVYERDPQRFLDNLENFLGLCEKHRMQMMPVIFDSCFGEFPDLEKYRDKDWMACPGQNRLDSAHWPELEKYVRDVVGGHVNDKRIVMWDVMNEPWITSFNKEEDKALIRTFLDHFLEFTRQRKPTQPLTVGLEFSSLVADWAGKLDVLCFHNYRRDLAEDIRKVKDLGRQHGKAVLINEVVGRPHQGFEFSMPVLREERVGWCFWELMLGRTQFSRDPDAPYQGLIFPDGTCFNTAEVAAVMGVSSGEAAQVFPQRRWTREQVWEWYKKQPWIVGFNYVPSTASNTTEFWSAETFDETTIDRELGWAQGLGFNTCRVFVQYLVWKHDPAGLRQRIDKFLTISSRHDLTTTLVLFDDCAFGDPPQTEPYPGKQRDPIPGMILPSWTPSPGHKTLADPGAWPDLEKYIKEIVGTFREDKRVLMWDLYNEPSLSLPLVEATFAWARAVEPSQPLTMGPFGGPGEFSRRQLELSDVTSFHFYGNCEGLRNQITTYKKYLRPVINTEWMARLQGSCWETDLPLFKQEAVGCYNWGLVNGRTQAQFAWYHKRDTPEPDIWFHDLFHRDGQPYDPAEHQVIRATTTDKTIDWSAADYSTPSKSDSGPRPHMLFGDTTRHGRPFAKDPCVLRLGERYLMYYSMAPSNNSAVPKGWAIGIAESSDLVHWKKVGEMLPEQVCERNGLVNGKAILLGGKIHLFYNSYGNGKNDALCHAVSEDGLKFTRDRSNPILCPTGEWNSGRAIDCDAFEFGGKLWLIYATRDPSMQIQMLVAATADLTSDFGRAAWSPVGEGPILKPELPWETRCIEAPSVSRRGGTLYLFYGGGYNNDPQQIGCATSTDGIHWTRLFREPLIPNGQLGDWNSSETGHPGVFTDADGRTYLFVQGNNDKGHTWYLSAYEIAWQNVQPAVLWDSDKFPMKRPGPAAHSEGGITYSKGWTCWRGLGPRGDGLHHASTAGATAAWEFQGSTATVVHKTGPDCGIARVLIDGQPVRSAELDTYSPNVEWNHETVVARDLAGGRHSVTIVVSGKHSEKSLNDYVQIVEFK